MKFLKSNPWMEFLVSKEKFIYIYMLAGILWFFPFLGAFLNPVCKLAFVWGILLLAYEFFIKHIDFRKNLVWLLLFFMISFVVTILINIKGNAYMGIKHFIYTCIAFFLIYRVLFDKKQKQIYNYMHLLNRTIIIVACVASCASLLMYIFSISVQIDYFGTFIRQGVIDQRLFGVYTSANTGALMALISIGLSCLDSYILKEQLFNWSRFYWVNAVIQIIFFSLTLSRGGQVTMWIAIIVGITVCYVPKHIQKLGLVKSYIRVIGLSVISIAIISIATLGIRNAMMFVPPVMQNIRQSILSSDTEEDELSTELKRIETGDDVSNGRYTIWSGGLKLWKHSILFGVADARIDNENMTSGQYDIRDMTQSEAWWLNKADGNLHNFYIQVLVNSGIVGLLLILVFAVMVAIQYFRYLLDNHMDANKNYYLIGIILTFVAAMAVNGAFENRILFDRQDPYGLMFWFYIGAGVALMQVENSKKKRKIACVCDTPLQVLNAVNYRFMHQEDECDLFLSHQFQNSEMVASCLKDSQLFSNVYNVELYKEYNPRQQKVVTLFRFFFPKYVLKRYIREMITSHELEYGKLGVSFVTPLAITLYLASNPKETFLFEDGIGSYTSDIARDYSSNVFKVFTKMILGREDIFEPKCIFLYHPDLYKGNVRPILRFNKEMFENKEKWEVVKTIFSYKENQHYTNKLVYLTQPICEREDLNKDNYHDMNKLLKGYLKDTLVRVHPREAQEEYRGFNIDNCNNLWEIECFRQINEKNILLGAFSTAQFMPKILKDVEPTIILTYKICLQNVSEIDNFVKEFSRLYEHQERIIVPESMQELKSVLNGYVCKEEMD